MKRFRWECTFVVGLLLLMGACSTSKPKSDAETDTAPSAEVGIEGAPMASIEEPPTDSVSAAPVDPAPVKVAKSRQARASGTDSYTVQKGDTLMKIAFEMYGDIYRWKDLYETNKDKIKDPNNIPPGITIVCNGGGSAPQEQRGQKYLIKKGDTLGSIAAEVYGSKTRWKELWENNKQLIRDPNHIFAGFYLYYLTDGASVSQNEPAAPVASASQGKSKGAGVAKAPESPPQDPAIPSVDGAGPDDLATVSIAPDDAPPSL